MKTLLLIEDDKILRENTQELLELHGYTCLTAVDGLQGLYMAKTVAPDLILCDVMLPQLNGDQIKAELNKDANFKNIPIIFFSASTDFLKNPNKGFELSDTDFILKPYKINVLIGLIAVKLHPDPPSDMICQNPPIGMMAQAIPPDFILHS